MNVFNLSCPPTVATYTGSLKKLRKHTTHKHSVKHHTHTNTPAGGSLLVCVCRCCTEWQPRLTVGDPWGNQNRTWRLVWSGYRLLHVIPRTPVLTLGRPPSLLRPWKQMVALTMNEHITIGSCTKGWVGGSSCTVVSEGAFDRLIFLYFIPFHYSLFGRNLTAEAFMGPALDKI